MVHMNVTMLTSDYHCALIKHRDSKDKQEDNTNYFRVMSSHGSIGGMTPTSLSSPSANKARTTQPTHILMIEALRLCLLIAASIISWTSARLTNSDKSNSNKALTAQDMQFQEERRKRKVRRLDFEVRWRINLTISSTLSWNQHKVDVLKLLTRITSSIKRKRPMDQHTYDNWVKIKETFEKSGNTDNMFYKRSCAIVSGKPDPLAKMLGDEKWWTPDNSKRMSGDDRCSNTTTQP